MIIAPLIAATLATAHPFPQSPSFPVTKKILANGTTVIIAEKRDLPIVSYQTWFQVGSCEEAQDQDTGLAHLFEHLMFSGTKKFPKSATDRFVESRGGSLNAFTGKDYTQYHVDIRSDQVDAIIEMDSDRLRNLSLTQQKVDDEKRVVLEERRQTLESDYPSLIDATLWEKVFQQTPCAHPIIGSRKSIESATLDQIKNWWKSYYVGSRMVLVIAGDVSAQELLPKIESSYGPVPKGSPRTPSVLSLKEGTHNEVIPWDNPQVMLTISYPTVPAVHADTYVLDVLSEVLHESRVSRLQDAFFERTPIATDVSGGHRSGFSHGLFMTSIVLKPGVPSSDAVNIYMEALDQISRKGVSEQELRRIRSDLVMEFQLSHQSIQTIGHMLALNELLMGDYQHWWTDIPLYNKVSGKDVVRAVRTYLQPARRTIISGEPKSR